MLSRILAFAPALVLLSGCGSSSESLGGSSQNLPTPVPIFHSVASARTEHDLGIAEWRIYRGVHETILTGYDASGRARKGIALGAYADTKNAHAHFRARILDGSRVVVRPVFGAASATEGNVTHQQWLLLNDAFHDLDNVVSSLAKSDDASSATNSCTAGVVATTYSGIACSLSASVGGFHAETINSCVVSAKLASDVSNAGCMKTLSDNASSSSSDKPESPESGNSSSASSALANEAFGTPSTIPNSSQGGSSDVLPPLSIIDSQSQQEGAESTQEQISAPEQSIDQSKEPAGSADSDVNNAASDATCASCSSSSSTNTQSDPAESDDTNGADTSAAPDVSASSDNGDTSTSTESDSGGDDSGFSDDGGDEGSGGDGD